MCKTMTEKEENTLLHDAQPDSVRSKKKLYMEFIRAFSMLLVIFNHTGTRGFFLFSVAENSVFYPFCLFLSVACKIAVPLYWMISGALLLPREESIKRVYTHRVLRMVFVLVFFSAAYFIVSAINNHQQIGPASIISFLITLYSSEQVTAFWFIYFYIGMMMMLPLFRKLVRNMPKQYFHYLFFLILFFRGILPMIEYLASTILVQSGTLVIAGQKTVSINTNAIYNLFSREVLYFFGGYYFDQILTEREITKTGAVKWLGVGFVAILATCMMTYYKIKITGLSGEADAQTFYNNLICLPTFAVFYSMRWLFERHLLTDDKKRFGQWKKVILSFGQCAFGIMLCQDALLKKTVFVYDVLAPAIRCLPACMIWILVVYLSGYVITLLMKKVPGLRLLI